MATRRTDAHPSSYSYTWTKDLSRNIITCLHAPSKKLTGNVLAFAQHNPEFAYVRNRGP